MTNFLIREALVPNLSATTKEGAIRELVMALQTTEYFSADRVEAVVGEVLRRESLGSTGIGRGIAIPHSRFEGLPKLIGTIGISRSGIPFASIDHRNVHVVFLLLSRPDDPAPHLQALDVIVRTLESDDVLNDLLRCTTADEMWTFAQNAPVPWEE